MFLPIDPQDRTHSAVAAARHAETEMAAHHATKRSAMGRYVLSRREEGQRRREHIGTRGNERRGHRTACAVFPDIGPISPQHEYAPVVTVIGGDGRLLLHQLVE